MLTFDDDLAPAPHPRMVSPETMGSLAAGGILSPQFSREPVHDLDVEQQAMANGFRRVRMEDKVYDMVLDPSMFDEPVKISQWGRTQKRSANSRTPFICKTRLGQAPRRKPRARRTAGTGYWPSADPRRGKDYHADRVMKLFKPYEGRTAPKKVLKMPIRSGASPAMRRSVAAVDSGNWVMASPHPTVPSSVSMRHSVR